MTPFDPGVLQAMLVVFYPRASAAALRIARIDRPEYFAGAQISGAAGDELVLDDGRRFRCLDYAGTVPLGWRIRPCPAASSTTPAR